jgi:hypothetical protein
MHCERHRMGRPLRAPVRKLIMGPIAKRLRAYLKIDVETGCHLWTATRQATGYGRMAIDRRTRPAHRVAWELANGPIPPGMVVMHKVCDNPPCCNPAHLAIGAQADNNRDRFAKGRGKGARARDLERYPQWR